MQAVERVQHRDEDGLSSSDELPQQRSIRAALTAPFAGWGSPSLPLLLLSHACTALLTLLVTGALGLHPHLHFAPILSAVTSNDSAHPSSSFSPSSPNSGFLIPSEPFTPTLDVCNPAVAYPVSVHSSISRLCHQARPLKYHFQRPKRYHREDIAMTLLTVDAYKWDRDEACLSTWLTPLRTPAAYFGVGVARPAELQQPTLALPHTLDNYWSNLNKTFLALRELYQRHPNKAWYMQTSDDAYIDVDALLLRLDPFDSEQVMYIGGPVGGGQCWLTGKDLTYIGGGLGFVVSRGFLAKWAADIEGWMATSWLSERGVAEHTSKWGDVMVGCYMQQREVPVTHILGGHPEIPRTDNILTLGKAEYPQDNDRWWGYHHAEPADIFDIHALVTLQRIDQLQAQRQLAELALHAREAAIEQWQQNRRQLDRLTAFLNNPQLLAKAAAVERSP